MNRRAEVGVKIPKLVTFMNERNLDAVYLKRQDDFAWLTAGGKNYVGLGIMGNCGLLVTRGGLYAITNTIECPRMIEEERLEELGFKLVVSPWYSLDDIEMIRSYVDPEKVGYDYSSGHGIDVAGDIRILRASLLESEIERYHRLGDIVSRCIEETASEIKPGDTGFEIAGRMTEKVMAEGVQMVSMMCASDERISSFRHPILTMDKVGMRVQLGGNFTLDGLVCCQTRYVEFAKTSPELRRQLEINQTIDCMMMEASKPGRFLCDVLEDARGFYEKFGYGDEFGKHHQGGPIGYLARDYRVDFSHRIEIAENQAFCWNPSITGTKSEDTVISSSHGLDFITHPVIFPEREVCTENGRYQRVMPLEKY